ncbi:adenosine deaminase [Phenylobacterium sp. LjRoot225]|uniref:adenosine deaminase family protein n=1 Tax=Phenylobacterium sp. LjRoot225 TaxID=3342285 RepID=UPI003ED0041F
MRTKSITKSITTFILAALAATSVQAAPTPETRTAAALEAIRDDEARLRLFLQAFPKGGNLHLHSWGAAFAEDYIGWAVQDRLCISREKLAFVPPPCDPSASPPAASLGQDAALRRQMIDALSAPADPPPAIPQHDRFFATFERIGALYPKATPRELALIRRTAAQEHTLYVEYMFNFEALWPAGAAGKGLAGETDPQTLFSAMAPDIEGRIAAARAELTQAETQAAALLRCGQPGAEPGCGVEVRYMAAIARTLPPETVFAQMMMAFALADADPRIVGVNILEPEDDPAAISNYGQQMRMFRYLAARYPRVKASLHAGELTGGLVPPADLASHIYEAVTIAGARRIGHGVDIAYEPNAPALLATMAGRGIAVEINLSSNDVILGVRGSAHPLRLYRAAGVPVVLSTDDPGVLRIDLTHEYVRAVREQKLTYADIKALSRNALEYAFLPGASLWRDSKVGALRSECATLATAATPAELCATILKDSAKATVQWRLEQDFATFERDVAAR